MNSRKVTVTVTGTHRSLNEQPGTPQEEEQISVTVPGTCSYQNGKYFLMYEEDDGEGHATHSTVKIYEDHFEVAKRGAGGSSRMVFQAGERDESFYETPYGSFAMALCVENVSVRCEDTPSQLFLQAEASYILEWGGIPSSACTVCVTARSEE